MTDKFSFTWGLPELEGMGFVQVYQFMLETYAKLGVSRQEMLCLIHLARYHYNVPKGESRPSLTTIAHEMGYGAKTRVSDLVRSLESKGMLLVERIPGSPSVYNAHPFAKAAWDMFLKGVTENRNTKTVRVTENRNGVLRKTVTEEEEIRIDDDDGLQAARRKNAFQVLVHLGVDPDVASEEALRVDPDLVLAWCASLQTAALDGRADNLPGLILSKLRAADPVIPFVGAGSVAALLERARATSGHLALDTEENANR